MPTLTDLPDELLIQIFTQKFRSTRAITPAEFTDILNSHVITKRLYNLCHQAFFEGYMHHVDVEINSPLKANINTSGTLQDLYSPRVSLHDISEHLREQREFVSKIQRLRIFLKTNDPLRFLDLAAYEVAKETRRYQKLRTLEVVFLGVYTSHNFERIRGEMAAAIAKEVSGRVAVSIRFLYVF